MTNVSLIQTNLNTLEGFLAKEDYEKAYDVFKNIEMSMSIDPSKCQEEIILKMSGWFLEQFLGSSLSIKQKSTLCDRIIVHLSSIDSLATKTPLITHLFERANLDRDPIGIKYLAIALRIASLSPTLFIHNHCLNQIRDRVAEIIQTDHLRDIFGVAVGQDIDQKFKSGDLQHYLDKAKSLMPILGSGRVGEMMGVANEKISTLSKSGLEGEEAIKLSDLILSTANERDQFNAERTHPSSSLAEELQNEHKQFLDLFRTQFYSLKEKRFDPTEVRLFQEKIFQAFCTFVNEKLLSASPFFFFKKLPPTEHYLLTAFGSLGRREPYPFSDLEYSLLHIPDQDPLVLQQIAILLEFEMTLLGNNSLESIEKGTHTPQIARERFHFDDTNPAKNPELIAIPKNLIELQNSPYTNLKMMKHEIPYRYSLLKPTGLTPDHPLLRQYQQEIDAFLCQSIEGTDETVGQQRMRYIIEQLIGLFEEQEEKTPFPTNPDLPTLIDLKKQLIHPLFVLLETLAIYHTSVALRTLEQQALTTQTNTLDLIEGLVKIGGCTPASGQLLRETVAALYTTRVRLHLEYDHACDKGSFTQTESADWVLLDKEEKSVLMTAYWLILTPLYRDLKKAIDNQTPLPIIDLLSPSAILTWNTITMKVYGEYVTFRQPEDQLIDFYRHLSTGPLNEHLRQAYLEGLKRGGAPAPLLTELSQIPNLDGYRQSYRIAYDALYTDIQAMTTPTPPDPTNYTQITSPTIGQRYLKEEILQQIINKDPNKGFLCKGYEALHNVAKATLGSHSLHFKEHPTQPWMDYAICNLFYRLFGHGAIPTELVKVTLNKNGLTKTYYVQISKTVEGPLLSDVNWSTVKLDQQKVIEMMIGTIIAKPADGRRSNYLMVETKGQSSLISIDNDASLVDPVVVENNQLFVLFKSALFCYDPLLNLPVDTQTMKAFFSINPIPLLINWASDVIKTQEKWVAHAFDNQELADNIMDALLNNKEQECNLRFLMREGGLFNLFSQIFQLQHYFSQCLRDKIEPKPLELLTQLVGIGTKNLPATHIGKYVYNQYLKGIKAETLAHLRLAYNTGDLALLKRTGTEQSRSRSETLAMTLGSIPISQDIKFTRFSIEQSLQEISGLSGFGGAIVSQGQCRTVQANFKKMKIDNQPDLTRQQIFLGLLTQIKDIDCLDLSHSAVLDDQILRNILLGSPNLRYLNTSHCPKLTFQDLDPLVALTKLEELHFSHCPGLLAIQRQGFVGFFQSTLLWPNLKKLWLNHCENLTTLNLTAPNLEYLNIKNTPELAIQNLEAINLVELNCTNSNERSILKGIGTRIKISDVLHLDNMSFATILAFGKSRWKKFFGEIGEEPALPSNMNEILMSPCPIWNKRKVFETHLLVLVPQTLNGQPLTLNRLGEIIKSPKEGYKTEYRYTREGAMQRHGNFSKTSHWVLMTKDVIEGSRGKSYVDQQRMVVELGGQYRLPSVLDAAVCILMEYVESGTRLYKNSPPTYTRCQEEYEGDQMVVGGFKSSGLRVNNFLSFDNNDNGVAALWII